MIPNAIKSSLFALLVSVSLGSSPLAQTPEIAKLGRSGPYQVAYYTQLPAVPEFGAATLYFPANKGQDFSGVVIAPGYIEQQENISWWGNHLASHGFAVLTIDTNSLQDSPQLRAEALMAGVELLRGENTRMGGTLRGKFHEQQMAVMGHSMGGGGALLAANNSGGELKAAIPLTPWLPDGDFGAVAVPTLLISGETDRIAAVADHARPHYQSLPEKLTKMYLEIKGGNHFIANSIVENEGLNPNIDVRDLVGGMAVAWLKLFVDGEEAYRELVFGELDPEDADRLSQHLMSE